MFGNLKLKFDRISQYLLFLLGVNKMECGNILKCITKYHYHNFVIISNNVWHRSKVLVFWTIFLRHQIFNAKWLTLHHKINFLWKLNGENKHHFYGTSVTREKFNICLNSFCLSYRQTMYTRASFWHKRWDSQLIIWPECWYIML